jgi:hypothetical protein
MHVNSRRRGHAVTAAGFFIFFRHLRVCTHADSIEKAWKASDLSLHDASFTWAAPITLTMDTWQQLTTACTIRVGNNTTHEQLQLFRGQTATQTPHTYWMCAP